MVGRASLKDELPPASSDTAHANPTPSCAVPVGFRKSNIISFVNLLPISVNLINYHFSLFFFFFHFYINFKSILLLAKVSLPDLCTDRNGPFAHLLELPVDCVHGDMHDLASHLDRDSDRWCAQHHGGFDGDSLDQKEEHATHPQDGKPALWVSIRVSPEYCCCCCRDLLHGAALLYIDFVPLLPEFAAWLLHTEFDLVALESPLHLAVGPHQQRQRTHHRLCVAHLI